MEVFSDTVINITTEGHKHLGAAIGSRSYLKEYVGEKVEDWVNQVTKLAEFAGHITTSGKLCSVYIWATAPMDVFHEDTARYC